MKKRIFIQSNDKQYLGAVLSKFSVERFFTEGDKIPVTILNTDEIQLFKDMRGKTYKTRMATGEMERTYTNEDLQSFTFSRFMPPELMGYEGRALVIDPDVFALCDVRTLFDMDLGGHAIAAVAREGGNFKSSVMVLDCEKLRHWKIETILKELAEGTRDAKDLMALRGESILALDPGWNSHDKIDENTKLLHCTRKLTQPWKTGLPIDFLARKPMPRFLGIIPREWIHKALGRYHVPTHYEPHPQKEVEKFFLQLAQDAVDASVLTEEFVLRNISEGHVRPDLREKLTFKN